MNIERYALNSSVLVVYQHDVAESLEWCKVDSSVIELNRILK